MFSLHLNKGINKLNYGNVTLNQIDTLTMVLCTCIISGRFYKLYNKAIITSSRSLVQTEEATI